MKVIRALVDLCLLIPMAVVAYSWLGTTTYAPGQVPERRFPIVIYATGTSPPSYRLVDFRDLQKLRLAEPTITLSLPESHGAFKAPPQENLITSVAFTAGAAPNGQRVTVTYKTEDYDFETQYLVSGTSLQPERLFQGHAMTMLSAVVIGLVGAEALFHLLRDAYRRFWGRRRNNSPAAP